MNEDIILAISKELGVKVEQVQAVLELLENDHTVAFIARYRKEVTGGLDEEQIRIIDDQYQYGLSLKKRKDDVLRLIDEKGLLTDDLKEQILSASKLIEVEDLYRPYKEKKKTKATTAIALGLEPLADLMLSLPRTGDKISLASQYITEKVPTVEEAILQAKYIVAEKISDNAEYRKHIREAALKYGTISSKKKNNDLDAEEKYKNYYETTEKLVFIKAHRVLAMNRAENEEVITVTIGLQPERDVEHIRYHVTHNVMSIFNEELLDSIQDAYKRLIAPSIQREIRVILTEKAEEQAIHIFSLNLQHLLLQAPMKGRVVLGVDPAFRTGCKLAVISPNSKVLEIGVIYPNERTKGAMIDPRALEKSKRTLVDLLTKYKVEIIAIGNGTASRETESFIAEVIKENHLSAKYVVVSEAGASVYSASPLAMEEFPDLSVEQRSAISIARRIQDPLAELVKIEPRSIGVGQYQHDIAQNKLNKSLEDVVVDAVNKVGVNLNTCSPSLLGYVSGLSKSVAKNIIDYREANNQFLSREELKKVAKLGPKTYEQCVGFLRILGGSNPLDMTPIHPESYKKAEALLKEMGLSSKDIGSEEMKVAVSQLDKEELQQKYDIDKYTLNDILGAFVAPLRDIRDSYPGLKLRSDIMHFEDVKIGDELDGIVRNVVDFGAFVDCGVKYDGLLHISKMSTQKINHPSDILNVGDEIHVYVIDIDYDKHKMGLALYKM
ncbi:MAG: RNA-binding transcriptional accessory protein [Anaeroplasmataceae bacterium]|nr:RNA-binding transcriptional accessory protein [Anaeroplasmataceae bacterium]